RQPRVPARSTFEQRCADALVALASGSSSSARDRGSGGARAEVVLNVDLAALSSDGGGCHLEGGPAIHPEMARRLSCDCRLQAVLRDGGGGAVGIGRRSRSVPGWLLRELLGRDHGCTFPGCGTRRFLAAHHVIHWAHGGPTQLDNLVLVCSFHHRLVHEGAWKVRLVGGVVAEWSRPNGVHYDPALPKTKRDGPPRRRARISATALPAG
ncbi:MAG: hypothetical protein QOG21_921, partial [Actinomycetota bacterium]|nr:hypothetical protein [Actinomycetota bacterium]